MNKHTLISKSLIHRGKIIDVYSEKVLVDEKEHTYDVVEHRGAVVLLPVTENETFLLVSQWRQAVKIRTIELPAGLLEKGEGLEAAARRECQEEIGYNPKTLTPFMKLITAPGFTNETLHVFLAKDLVSEKLEGDETEDIEILEFSRNEIQEAIQNGQIVDTKTIAVLYHYFMEHQ